MHNLKFRKINNKNITRMQFEQMYEIENEVDLHVSFSKKELYSHLKKFDVVGAFVGDKLIGFVVFARNIYFDDEYYIYNFEVKSEYRGQGVGTKMLGYAYKNLIKDDANIDIITLDVEVSNPAKRMYQRLGFESLCTNRCIGYEQELMATNKITLEENLKENIKLQQNRQKSNDECER